MKLDLTLIPRPDLEQFPKLCALVATAGDPVAKEVLDEFAPEQKSAALMYAYRKGHIMKEFATGKLSITSGGEKILGTILRVKYTPLEVNDESTNAKGFGEAADYNG